MSKNKEIRIGVSIETSEYARSQGVDNCISVAFYQATERGKGVEAIYTLVNDKTKFPNYHQYLNIAPEYANAKKFVEEKNRGNFSTFKTEKEKSTEFDEIAIVFHRVSFLLPNEQAYIQGFVNDIASRINKKVKDGKTVKFEPYNERILEGHTQDAELTQKLVDNIPAIKSGKHR